ncbi:cytochrome b561 domain-containing At2g30890-like [Olea europaea subsp. europaea]|uniref:Cytochrome b561 domain-containing At2g30890-like n=1 Tax=Olea europaea subsp. europaea TaxID=158383 RepID=A0A8S0U241_OLEEU|nr:cytochrome b561 domain-containing At2g30890-like [Olea europaea subsp. europaea]
MQSTKILLGFAMPAVFLVLNLLPLVGSSQEHGKTDTIHPRYTHKNHETTSDLLFEIKLHGFLLWASVGLLTPVGILLMRMSNRKDSRRKRIMFYIHAIIQSLSVFLATAGAVLSIRYFDNSFNNYHQRIGLALYGVICFQALIGILRPNRGRKGRSIWFIFHWLLGITVSMLGVVNVYTGLQSYHRKTSKSVRVWTIVFTAQISLIIFFYLLQEKWHYIKKQGVSLCNEAVQPTDQETSPRFNLKETSPQPC